MTCVTLRREREMEVVPPCWAIRDFNLWSEIMGAVEPFRWRVREVKIWGRGGSLSGVEGCIGGGGFRVPVDCGGGGGLVDEFEGGSAGVIRAFFAAVVLVVLLVLVVSSTLSVDRFFELPIISLMSCHPLSRRPGAPTSQPPFSFRPSRPKFSLPAPTRSDTCCGPPAPVLSLC